MKLPRVTDHAVLRYLERAKGLNIDALRRHIADQCAAASLAGAISITIDGVKFMLVDGAVTTTVPSRPGASRTTVERMRGRQ